MGRRRSVLMFVFACAIGALVWSVGAGATESKPEWQVTKSGVKQILKSGESETLSQTITSFAKILFFQTSGTKLDVDCEKLKFNESETSRITGTRGLVAGAILFEECFVIAPAGDTSCEVFSTGLPNHSIRTQALGFSAEEALEGSTTTPRIRWRPESTREEIVTFHLEGASCANKGTAYEVAGLLVANVDTSAQKKGHLWKFAKNTGTRLTIGGVEAEFRGEFEFTLKSGNEWGAA